jgi:hypothetical protein
MRKTKNVHSILAWKPEERGYLRDLGIDGSTTLKCIKNMM